MVVPEAEELVIQVLLEDLVVQMVQMAEVAPTLGELVKEQVSLLDLICFQRTQFPEDREELVELDHMPVVAAVAES